MGSQHGRGRAFPQSQDWRPAAQEAGPGLVLDLWEVVGGSGYLAQPGPLDMPISVCPGARQAPAEGQLVALRSGPLTPSRHRLFPPQAPCCLAHDPLGSQLT